MVRRFKPTTGFHMKVCRHCGESKPVDEFRANSRMRDGVHSWCKACTVARNREWVAEHRDKLNARRRVAYLAKRVRATA